MATSLLAGSITSNLTFTTKVPLLMKATLDDEKPTQGYVLQEISNISKSSLPNCQSLLNFLLGRLESKYPCIKFKVLHLMKYLVINGHSEFRSGLRRNAAEVVKQTTSFKGELDAIHGDGLNIKVRQAASELELLLFDVDNPEVERIYRSMLAPNQSGKKMEGFGYSGAPVIKKEASLLEKLKDSVPKIMMNKANSTQITSIGQYQPSIGSYHSKQQYTPVELSNEHECLDSEMTSDSCITGAAEDSKICERSDEGDSHYYERKLVNNITAKRGVRNIPSKEELKDFVSKSASLDSDVILELLDKKLQDPSKNVQLKSLCVIEYLLRCDLKDISRSINDNCRNIHTLLCDGTNTSIQAKAKKITLTIESCLKQEELEVEDKASAPPSYEHAKEFPTVDDEETKEYETKPTTDVKRATELESLFSGMKVSTTPSVDVLVTTNTDSNQPEIVQDLLGEAEFTAQGTGTSFGANYESESMMGSFDPLLDAQTTDQRVSIPGNSQVDLLFGTDHYNSNLNPLEMATENSGNASKVTVNGASSQPSLFNPNTVDLLTFQPSMPAARNHSVTGGLGLTANVSSSSPSSERRPFPKDMKQEVIGFGFIRKSSKKDAFSFVSDEMTARKTKPK